MSAKGPYPHERRVQRHGYLALAATTILGAILVLRGSGTLLGIEIPLPASLGALGLGAIVGGVAIARRSDLLVGAAGVLLILAVLPAGATRPGLAGYALGILFGVGVLLLFELVHMTERYERAHRAVDEDGVPEEHINRVTDEALKTLVGRAALAAAGVAAATGLAYLLAQVGPLQWRAAAETTAPLGVAIAALALAGAVSLFILARGATFRLRREKTQQEMLPDVAE